MKHSHLPYKPYKVSRVCLIGRTNNALAPGLTKNPINFNNLKGLYIFFYNKDPYFLGIYSVNNIVN